MRKKFHLITATALAVGIMWWYCAAACAEPAFSFASGPSDSGRSLAKIAGSVSTTMARPLDGAVVLVELQGNDAEKKESSESGKKERAVEPARDEVQELKERILDIQNKGKLGFRKLVPCSSVEGFGAYSPIEAGQKVQKIVFYCEPANVSTLKSGDRYVIDCAVDCILMDTRGRVLAGKQNALKIHSVSRSPIIDIYFKFEIALKKSLDASVLLKTVLHDKIKNSSVAAIKKINVQGPHKTNLDGI